MRHDEPLSLFLERVKCSYKPNSQVLAAILKSCAAIFAIRFGSSLHGYALKLGHVSCHALCKGLLNLYAKSGALGHCNKLFGEMDKCDPVIWNIVLSGLATLQNNEAEVMRLFHTMHMVNEAKPNSVTAAIVLPVCARLQDLDAGKSVHSYLIKSGLQSLTLAGNALISMYAKCGLVCSDAYAAFSSIGSKDVVSWNAVISGFSENKSPEVALKLFHTMLRGPIQPNYATIASILPVCASLEENVGYRYGKEIHCHVLRQVGLVEDISVINSLMSFYLRIGQMGRAEFLFRNIGSRDLVSWNAIIAGYASNGEWWKALEVFSELVSLETIKPDSVTLVSLLPACVHVHNLQVAKEIHGYILRHPGLQEDTSVGNALLSFYAKCKYTQAALSTFLMISQKDLISWNTLLDAFTERSEAHFVNLLHWMLREGMRADSITILTIIQYYAAVSRVNKVRETHGYSIRFGLLQCDAGPTLGNGMLDAYAKCGNMKYAANIFEGLSEKRNVITCNSMISGYVNSSSQDDAYAIFSAMSETDITTWNLMVRVYAENDFPDQALSLFHELQVQGMKPDMMTIMSILPACAHMASVHMLRQCHGYVTRACFNDVRLNGALIDTYSKCGSVFCAYKLFLSNPQKDLLMFTAMVGGFAMHGMGEEALRVFSDALELGVKPDHVIITAVLFACSHAGLVDEGWKIFHSIEKLHGFQPTMEQYACVVDLLARGGRVKDAYNFVTRMPIEANANIWGTLLGACKTHHELELGRVVADHLFKIDADNIGNYVVMSNLYAAYARWDGVMEMRKLMRTRELKKPAGCSWIEVGGRKNAFIAVDSSHPQRSTIYRTLNTLDRLMKEPFRF